LVADLNAFVASVGYTGAILQAYNQSWYWH